MGKGTWTNRANETQTNEEGNVIKSHKQSVNKHFVACSWPITLCLNLRHEKIIPKKN